MKTQQAMPKNNVSTCMPVPRGLSTDQSPEIFGAVLPEQFYTPAQESHEQWTGERGLMLAVLQEAVQSYLKYSHSTTHRGRRLFEETRAWFWSQDLHYLFSFESICAYLRLDPTFIRRGLAARIQRQRSRPLLARVTYRRAAISSHRGRLAQAA